MCASEVNVCAFVHIYIFMCVCVCVCLYVSESACVSLYIWSVCVGMYVRACVSPSVCVYTLSHPNAKYPRYLSFMHQPPLY